MAGNAVLREKPRHKVALLLCRVVQRAADVPSGKAAQLHTELHAAHAHAPDSRVGLRCQAGMERLRPLPFSGAPTADAIYEAAKAVDTGAGVLFMEQYIAYNKVAQMLKDAGIKVYKSYVNEYCTSIDMAGCSVSLLRLDDEMKKYLDYPVEIPYAIF